jgi:hypothetical protein
MKVSHIGVIAVMLLVIAIAIAGCTSTQTSTTPAGGSGQASSAAGGSAASSGAVSSGSQSSSSSGGSSVSGSGLFQGLSYNWVEYKMSSNAGGQEMTVYFKYDKSGKCSMRFEGAAAANMPASMQNIDCSSKGGQTQANPNQVSSDAQVSCSPVDESVTVPAGTFSATKCTVSAKGSTSTVWVAKGKFLVKMEATSSQGGSAQMELNAYG